jgi:hypothetical protein
VKLALLTVAAVLIGAAGAGAGTERAKPTLRLLDRSPVKVSGRGFVPRERIRLTVIADTTRTRRVTAGPSGTFTATVLQTALPRCEGLRVVAIGGEGSRAVLKTLPQPACKTS